MELSKYEDLPHPNKYDAVSIVLIVIGLLIACVGVCGCCGALRKNVLLLKMVKISYHYQICQVSKNFMREGNLLEVVLRGAHMVSTLRGKV